MAKKKVKTKHLVNVCMLIDCTIEVKNLNDCSKEIKTLANQLNSIGINIGSIENIEEISQ